MDPGRIAAIGIANQRETTIVWDRATGQPVADAIVWQSRITAAAATRSGPPATSRCSATEPGSRSTPTSAARRSPRSSIATPGLRSRAEARRARLRHRRHVPALAPDRRRASTRRTSRTRAGRSSSTSIDSPGTTSCCALVGVPRAVLPEVRPTSGVFGETDAVDLRARRSRSRPCAGDQQAATFGQACFRAGQAKNTYGTGAFLLMNTGERPVASANGLLTTVGWQLGPGAPATYALEGSVFSAGSAVQWLRDGLRPIATRPTSRRSPRASTTPAASTSSPRSRGSARRTGIPTPAARSSGITRGTGLAEIARADDRRDRLPGRGCRRVRWRPIRERARRPAGRRRSGRATTCCASSRPTSSASRSSGRSSPRRPRSARPYLAGLASEYWPDADEIVANWAARSTVRAGDGDRPARVAAPRLASRGRALAELGRAGRLTARGPAEVRPWLYGRDRRRSNEPGDQIACRTSRACSPRPTRCV